MTIEMQQLLIRFKQRYEDIKQTRDKYIEQVRLGALVTDMENTFQIPLFGADRIAAFNREFPEINIFYRQVTCECAI